MRTKLGLAVATMTAASVLAFGVPAGATPDDTVAPDTTEAPVETDAPPVTEETTTTTTTTTVPLIDGPADMDSTTNRPPTRGSQVVINPAPTTTTTTVPPAPDFSLPANSGTGRRIVYSKTLQKVWVVDSAGRLIKEHRVSGRQLWCDPRIGEYRVFSKSRYTFAIQNPAVIWGYMVRFTKGCQGGNIGFHEIPTNSNTGRKLQSISQLGTPLSAGCARQAPSDARWIFNWAYVGTKVVVLP